MYENVNNVYYCPMYAYETIELPDLMVQSKDCMAQVAVKFVRFANSLKEYADLLVVPFDSIKTVLPRVINNTELNGLKNTLTIRNSDDG